MCFVTLNVLTDTNKTAFGSPVYLGVFPWVYLHHTDRTALLVIRVMGGLSGGHFLAPQG